MDAREFNRLLKSIAIDKSSIEKLYMYYYPRIVLHLSNTYGKVLAEDAAQDFFIRLTYVAQKQNYINSPTSWIYTCADNIAKRKITYESRYTYLKNESAVKTEITNEEIFGELYEAVEKLDTVSQKILKLYYFEGYNQNEIADKLEIKQATIRQKHSRAIKKIKKYL